MENRELIAKAQKGDKEAMSLLVKENSALIWSIVRKYSSRGYDMEDLFQTGAMGFIKCIERFDLNFVDRRKRAFGGSKIRASYHTNKKDNP